MRTPRLRTSLLTAVLTCAAVVGLAAPASAGTGWSQHCSNGAGWFEYSVPNATVTVGVELVYSPTSPTNFLIVCYSTTPIGTPSDVAGGVVFLSFGTNGSTSSPSAYANLHCNDDQGDQTVDLRCAYGNAVAVQVDDRPVVTTPPSTFCVLSGPGGCQLYLPGLEVSYGADPDATVFVRVLNVAVPVDTGADCIGILVPSC